MSEFMREYKERYDKACEEVPFCLERVIKFKHSRIRSAYRFWVNSLRYWQDERRRTLTSIRNTARSDNLDELYDRIVNSNIFIDVMNTVIRNNYDANKIAEVFKKEFGTWDVDFKEMAKGFIAEPIRE